MITKRITIEEAWAAIQACARDGKIASVRPARDGLLMYEEDNDLAVTEVAMRSARLAAYQDGPFGFNLAVLFWAELIYFDVPGPEDMAPVESDDLLERHGSVILNALSRWSGQQDDTRDAEMAALRALRTYLGRDW